MSARMLGWYVHHQGSGHLQRMLAVTAHLRAPVTVLSSLAAPAGCDLPWVHLPLDAGPDEAIDPAGHGMPAPDPTAHDVLHWAPVGHPGLLARTAVISSWLASAGATALVVDASVEVALLARLHGVRVAVVAAPGTRTDGPHSLAYQLADVRLAPWPAWAHPLTAAAEVAEVGAFSRLDGAFLGGSAPSAPPAHVVVLVGSGGADHGVEDVRAAAAACPGTTWTVLGMTGASTPGVDVMGHVDDVARLLETADVVVVHAGQNAVAEVAAARRPAVVVAQQRPFGEQAATTRVLDDAAIAVGVLGWPAAAAWPDLLARAAALGGAGWVRWSDGGGAQRAAALLERTFA